MQIRHFTVDEANEILPEIDSLMEKLQARRTKMIAIRKDIIQLLKSQRSDFGGRIPSDLVNDFIAIEKLADEIRSHGCIIKDLNTGLVDFLSKREGREVYLCWRYGEPKVEYFHELHTGFRGRQQI